MKKLICEMCGSTELIKTDGLFVCQSCGCKYTLEEAKNMMIEVDTSVQYANIVKLAREFFEDNNYEDAKKYATEALVLVANNPEMIIVQGLSDLGQQHNTDRVLDVPSSTVNSVRRALEAVNEVNDIVEKEMILKIVEDNINSVVSVKIDRLNSDIERIEKINKDLKFDSNKTTVDLAKRQMLNSLAGYTGRYDRIEQELNKELHDGDYRMAHKIGCRIQIKKYKEFLTNCEKDIEEKKKEISALKKHRNEEIIEDFFAKNPGERTKYDQNVRELKERKETIEKRLTEKRREVNEAVKEINSFQTPLQKQKRELSDQISELERQRNGLGFFKKKEIKAINEKIMNIKNQFPNDYDINKQVEEYSLSLKRKIDGLNREIEDILSSKNDVEHNLKSLEEELLEAASE